MNQLKYLENGKKKIKNIILTKGRTKVEFKDVDGWLIDLRYLVSGKETYYCQILLPDLPGKVKRLKKEGFKA
jgi:hypothetical protein